MPAELPSSTLLVPASNVVHLVGAAAEVRGALRAIAELGGAAAAGMAIAARTALSRELDRWAFVGAGLARTADASEGAHQDGAACGLLQTVAPCDHFEPVTDAPGCASCACGWLKVEHRVHLVLR